MRRRASVIIRYSALGVLGALALLLPAHAGAATLIGDYRFDDSLSSSVGSAPPLTEMGPPGTFSTATIGGESDRVLSFPEEGGLQLPQSAVPDPSAYSTLITFAFDDVTGYRRILASDTFVADNDNGLYNLDGRLDFFDDASTTGAVATLADGVFADVAFTRSGDGRAAGFVNGVNQLIHADVSSHTVVRADGLRFFRDNTTDENGSGEVARIRLYDGALTDAEVLDIEQTGGLRPSADVVAKPKAGPRKKKPTSIAAGISLTCPAEGVPCPFSIAITARMKGGTKAIGALAADVPSGASVDPGVELNKRGRKFLAKKGKQPVVVAVTLTAGSGATATATNHGRT